MHVGGVQEAVTDPAPGPGVPTEQVSPVHEVAATAPGLDVLQVKGILVRTGAPVLFGSELFPRTSVTVAVTGSAVPLFVLKAVSPDWSPFGVNCNVMFCTGQVSKKSQTKPGCGVVC